MPTYSFKERFVPFVKDKTKTQTIRKIRKNPPRVGQFAYLYTGPRFNPIKILPDEPAPVITAVDTVFIFPDERIFLLRNKALCQAEADGIIYYTWNEKNVEPAFYNLEEVQPNLKDVFAWFDGFRNVDARLKKDGCFKMFIEFFKETHAQPFAGHITYWQF